MRDILNYLFEHKKLSRMDAYEVLTNISKDKYTESEVAAFLSVYIMRSITVDELAGFRDALLDLCLRINLPGYELIDMCGTGGDGKDTFNISTLASFVVAGTGAKVAKHGNYGVSSGCGSSNVIEYFGYKFTNDESLLKKDIEEAGICFLHAPLFHPAMKAVGPIRKKLRVKTFFNMLGPMVNPCFPQNQVVGVFSLELARIYNYIYQQTNKKYVILHSTDGYDEISLTGNVKLISNSSEQILSPEEFGFTKIEQKEIKGGSSIPESAKIFTDILEGKGTTAQNNVVLANAAIGIKCLNQNKSIADCIGEAKDSLFGKKALNTFKKLINT
ncbi:MAG: anthranilate phosphoribosyltransferase [Bacteroidales bacterium]|nr:anthranilate phosphoribosyltransferase [Bacteroidales bacterium]